MFALLTPSKLHKMSVSAVEKGDFGMVLPALSGAQKDNIWILYQTDANVLQLWIGMVKDASLVHRERFSCQKQGVVNVHHLLSGMVLDVPSWLIAQMVLFGMFILIDASAQNINIGVLVKSIVWIFLNVQEEEYSMHLIDVFAHKTIIGIMNDLDVNSTTVFLGVDKFLLETNVVVQLEETGMAVNAYNVLMAKFGLNHRWVVNVQMVMNGLEFYVIEHTIVLETEFGTQPFSNVSALQLNTGMEDNAPLSRSVVEEEFWTFTHTNVSVGKAGIGIQKIVCIVNLDKFGTNLTYNAYVLEEPFGMMLIKHAGLFKIAEMDKLGTQIYGDVNVLQTLITMAFTVLQIHVRMAESGMTRLNAVFALTTKSGIQDLVFLQELIAQMDVFGTLLSMLAVVLLVHSPILTNAIQFLFA